MWFGQGAIPYPEMWADDRLWMPLLLGGKRFRGRFLFDGETMLEHELVVDESLAGAPHVE